MAPTLNSMPAAANAAGAAPARSRQVVSCGLDRGFLAAGGVGWVAGQAAGAIAPSEKPVAGAAAGRRLAAAGWTPLGKDLRCSARISSGSSGTAGADWIGETTKQPVCTFGCVYPCRLSVSVWHSVYREVALTARDARGYCDSTCRLNGVRLKR